MPFFARPNIDDIQFKQISGTTITLSGQTRIATSSGLTLYDDVNSKYIPIIVTGATDNTVLTYLNNKITLQPISDITGNVYTGYTPTTCTVGGLVSGTDICNCSFTCIVQDILVPPLNPVVTEPSSGFSIFPSATLYEVGTCVCIDGYSTFDRGCVVPQYCGSPDRRSGTAISYIYCEWGLNTIICPNTTSSNPVTFTPFKVINGENCLSSKVCYSAGLEIFNSRCGTYCSALPPGTTSTSTITINGILPYFYGKVSSGNVAAGVNRPSATVDLITGGTSITCRSNDTICIDFDSTSDDYIWFATPVASNIKTCWFVDSTNNGNISGSTSSVGGNLFTDPVIVDNVSNKPTSCGCWSGESYNLYISNYQTTSGKIMEFRNN